METDTDYKLKIGDSAPDFNLPSTDGHNYKRDDFTASMLVVFFTCNHCPYAQAYEERMQKFSQEYAGRVEVVAINSNDAAQYPQDSFENMVKRAKEKKLFYSYLHDESQAIAKAYGGQCTPHFFVFDKERRLRYQGRFDDNWENPDAVQTTELKEAVEAVLNNEDVPLKVTSAIGCSIKWK